MFEVIINMIYLDYSATTMVNSEVLKSFNDSMKYIGNPNSLHKLGVESKKLIDAATNQIANLLKIKSNEIIYTSGASESNNLAIIGTCLQYKNRGKHIITTNLEHSSIYGPINFLTDLGYEVDFVPVQKNGLIDLVEFEKLIRDDTVLVSINMVNSEIGIKQNIKEISNIIRKYPKCIFHADITQALGKIDVDLSLVDLASFSAHKIYGIKGIGALYKKDGITLTPLIHGGKSTTIYRSGTPTTNLIVSLAKSIRLCLENLENKYNHVLMLNKMLVEELKQYDKVSINSNENCIPHILNISILGVKPETMLHNLEEHDIYISTQSACSKGDYSKSVMTLTNNQQLASSSIRISISHITTKEEIEKFLIVFKDCYNHLIKLKENYENN